ncbi:RpiB/LacA/LacB family sugar-phosphate isomerase [Sphingomonas bacterium]|uniref:RpiB/LacA/LacB family sugar-phosphate isomerase n=1 Tax=Sphingomonas bacterium TaxID=1895847 RepID=UPI0026707859|nr:RpiB/LacA/LacB family sugar-phosphate isomerase [Sphingomonas bacterium]
MKVLIGGDSAGQPLVDVLFEHLASLDGIDVTRDVPAAEDERYAYVADRVANAVRDERYERAVLICGTGLGVSIAANKVPGIRAALAHDTYSAERAVKSNDAQILALGARVIGPELAKAVVGTYLAARYDPASHSAANIAAIDEVDARYSSR